jgi:hypothetical protein
MSPSAWPGPMDDSGLVGTAVALVVLAVLGAGATAVYLYSADYALKAEVQDTSCAGPLADDRLNVVAVKTDLLGVDHDVAGVPDRECTLLRPGDRVVYHVRTKHTILYDAEGNCLYDSVNGFCGGLPL